MSENKVKGDNEVTCTLMLFEVSMSLKLVLELTCMMPTQQ